MITPARVTYRGGVLAAGAREGAYEIEVLDPELRANDEALDAR